MLLELATFISFTTINENWSEITPKTIGPHGPAELIIKIVCFYQVITHDLGNFNSQTSSNVQLCSSSNQSYQNGNHHPSTRLASSVPQFFSYCWTKNYNCDYIQTSTLCLFHQSSHWSFRSARSETR